MDDMLSLQSLWLGQIRDAQDLKSLEELRVRILGKKGELTAQMRNLKNVPPDQRKARGAALNGLKREIIKAIEEQKRTLEARALQQKLSAETIDITLPPRPQKPGMIHPISQTIDEMIAIFGEMGFQVAEGPDIEEDFYNFTALNIPPEHPARQEHDTFYLPWSKEGTRKVLRTHTSPVQIRTMLSQKPPLRIIAPGRTYRCDYDATHSPMFHQLEGLVIDTHTHMGELKGCLIDFCRTFFDVQDLPVRFRASYFPFTEPSAEVDIGCGFEEGALKIGAGDQWLEILGCGMVHPNVLANCGLDPKVYQGFAFGVGIERVAMLKYGIPDLRTFYEADLRWLHHYGFVPLQIPTLVGGLHG